MPPASMPYIQCRYSRIPLRSIPAYSSSIAVRPLRFGVRRDRVPTRGDWARLSGEWKKRIDQRIAELQRLRAGLAECIGCGCLSIDRCDLANPADRAGRRGPGPRYWLG